MLTLTPIKDLIGQQRDYLATGNSKKIEFRINQLKKLKQAVIDHKQAVIDALKADLNKPEFEAYFEIIGVNEEIDYAIKNLKSWVKPKSVKTPLTQFPASAKIYPEPLGVVLIIGPWNYPFSLILTPLVGAIAAGNCAILKPSELAPHTSGVVAQLIKNTFDPAYINVVEGGIETSQQLLGEKFDHIFFTGGTKVGKIIMEAAAKHLTPVTLELGGKSPCIVDSNINLSETAKRITWGKFINSGQTCIAPDYLLVQKSIKNQLVEHIKQQIQEFYGDDPQKSPDYARIINERQFERLKGLLADGKIIVGGQTEATTRYIAPTVIEVVSLDSPVMEEEIFGPILPIIEYEQINEAIAIINRRSKPLALYLFSNDKTKQQQVLEQTSSGGVCLNDTVLQVGVIDLPFGGVGDSGIGNYHGLASFKTFSHYKSVLKRGLWFDLNWRYAPYEKKLKQLQRLLKS
ncbi:Aldehyde Dehydrogenase [Gloeothece citriformis PCC 7424]|uniref:Aldehyde dehydrogenase n=1 Tax=Gloeothece citriformis (strain PCC 7424) TaxID=65393 RepID=B7K9F2_GLOC7|nr:aldehyde dehydrogenase [Gloeothece citriformis]ACK68635.1 Aldehyde Dehydrogenase [Gloeothece citriformis PCC 7424]